MEDTENGFIKKLEHKQPKLLMRICYSIAATIVLLILMICIIVAQLIIKFLE